MTTKLPQPTALLLDRLQHAGRYLDTVAANCHDDGAHAIARAHANTVWQAAARLEDLATLVEEIVPNAAALRVRGES